MSETPATICTQCDHYHDMEPNSLRAGIWYNQLCKAVLLPTAIDPVDGRTKPYSVNDLGNTYYGEHIYEYCRNVNDGNCEHFTPCE